MIEKVNKGENTPDLKQLLNFDYQINMENTIKVNKDTMIFMTENNMFKYYLQGQNVFSYNKNTKTYSVYRGIDQRGQKIWKDFCIEEDQKIYRIEDIPDFVYRYQLREVSDKDNIFLKYNPQLYKYYFYEDKYFVCYHKEKKIYRIQIDQTKWKQIVVKENDICKSYTPTPTIKKHHTTPRNEFINNFSTSHTPLLLTPQSMQSTTDTITNDIGFTDEAMEELKQELQMNCSPILNQHNMEYNHHKRDKDDNMAFKYNFDCCDEYNDCDPMSPIVLSQNDLQLLQTTDMFIYIYSRQFQTIFKLCPDTNELYMVNPDDTETRYPIVIV